MQQQNNKKYKSNARAWYLPGYQKILFSQVFSKLYVKNPVNISFKLFSAFYRRFKPTVRAFSINSFPKLSFSSEKP